MYAGRFIFFKMKKLLFFIILLPLISLAQKQTDQVIEAKGIEEIVVLADEISNIEVKTANIQEIRISTKADGEYFQDIGLFATVSDEKIVLESRYRQNLVDGFDKLSAHKVFSFYVVMLIPENLNFFISADETELLLEGKFRTIHAEVKQGMVAVNEFEGSASINTYAADIFLNLKKPTVIDASSRNGTMEIPASDAEGFQVKLTSINGDIKVRKTK